MIRIKFGDERARPSRLQGIAEHGAAHPAAERGLMAPDGLKLYLQFGTLALHHNGRPSR